MPEGPSPDGSHAPVVPDGPPAARAAAWWTLARDLVTGGRPAPALLAAVTAAELFERVDDDVAATSCRALAGELSGTGLTVLTVGAAADAPGATPDEVRALWLGAPDEPVLAMIGWVERGGEVHVVRAVVPGTPRGRSAFRTLLQALPVEVPVRLELPARDREVVKAARRAGFRVVDGHPVPPPAASRYMGGTVVASRPAA
jgi:hypothetical protein